MFDFHQLIDGVFHCDTVTATMYSILMVLHYFPFTDEMVEQK